MIGTDNAHGLTVRQGLGDGSFGTDDAGHCISNAAYPSRCPRYCRKRGGFMQLRWFHIRGVCIAPGCVYRSSSAKRGMGIPGDHVNRVETYHHPLELAVVRELQSRVRLPTDEGTVQS